MPIKFLNDVAVDSSVLYVDTINNRVGVGTSSPDETFTLQTQATGLGNEGIFIKNPFAGSSPVVNSKSPFLSLGTATTSAYNSTIYMGRNATATNQESKIEWSNANNGLSIYVAGQGSYREHVRFGDLSNSTARTFFNGNVGIGTTSPGVKLDIVSSSSGSQIELTSPTPGIKLIDSNLTTRYAEIKAENGNINIDIDPGQAEGTSYFSVDIDNSEKFRITSAGNVGIGTTSPAASLHVNGSSGGTATFQGATQSTLALLAGSAYSYLVGTTAGDISLRPNGSASVTLKANGNVGIGTTSPSYKLDVNGTGRFSEYLRVDTTFDEAFVLNSTDDGPIYMAYKRNGDRHAYVGFGGSNDQFYITNEEITGSLYFNTVGGGIYVNSNGNVGIGTTSPGQKLEVEGNIRLSKSNDVTSGFELGRDGSTLDAFIIQRENADLFFRTNNSERMRIEADGNVGIGTTSPSEKLEVVGNAILDASNANLKIKAGTAGTKGDIQWTFNTDSTVYASAGIAWDNRNTDGFLIDSGYPITLDYASGYIRFLNNGSEKMRITSGGNVGIGLTNPVDRLDLYDSDDNVGMYFHTATSGTGGGNGLRVGQNNANAFVWNYEATPLSLATGGTARLTINATGGIRFNTGYGAGTLVTDASGNITVSSGGGAGGPYLPLSAGSSYPLTGDLYLDDDSGATPSLYFKNGANNFWRYLMESGGDFSIKEGTSTRLTFKAGGNVGIGTTNPANILHVSSDAPVITGTSTNNSSGLRYNVTGTASQVHRFQYSGLTLMTIRSTGNVGIGTTSPSAKLHIEGDGSIIRLQNNSSDANGTFIDFRDSTGARTGYVGTTGTSDDMFLFTQGAKPIRFYTNASERMHINSSGNVGIGTTSPDVKLEVIDASPTNGIIADFVNSTNAGGTIAAIKLSNADSEACDVVLGANRVGANFGSDFFISLSDSVDGSNQERFRITESGNVGIGTTAPSYPFEVNGGTLNTIANFKSADAGAYISFSDNSTTSGEYVQIGASGDGMVIRTGNAQAVNIASGGNVGIGTTSPSQKLHVSGNARVTGAYYDSTNSPGTSGQILSSTATGTDWIDGSAIPGVPDGSGTANKIVMWQDSDTLTDSILSQTIPYNPNSTGGIVNINGTLKQSATRKSIYIGENVGQSVNPTSAFLNIYNIGIGDDVLKDFTYGVVGANLEDPGDTVGIGYQALTGLLSGTNNVAVGTETLKALTLGANNIALGKNSLLALTGNRADSIGNVALGFNTLSSMTTGTYNVAIGNTNLEATTSASSVVSIGNDVAKPFTGTITEAVLIGNKVLANSTATNVNDAIIIGQNSGLATAGTLTNDILIGRNSFNANTSGGNNIAIGGSANQQNGSVNTSIAVTTRNAPGTGGKASSFGIVISTYDYADEGVGSPNDSEGKYSAIIGGIGNLNQGGNGFIGGCKTNTIVSTATNSAILGGFDNEIQSGGSGGMALGSNLQVNGNNQVVLGRFNTPNTNSKLIVGAGFSDANRINAFEVKNTSQLKLGKYGQTPANFPATSTLVNVLVVGAANNVTEIPVSDAAFNSQLLLPNTRSVTAGSTTNLSSAEEKIVKISWTGTTGNAILRLPLAGNFVNKTIRFITDSSFPATATAQITGNGGTETINGLTAGVTLTGTYKATMVWSDGTEWWVL